MIAHWSTLKQTEAQHSNKPLVITQRHITTIEFIFIMTIVYRWHIRSKWINIFAASNRNNTFFKSLRLVIISIIYVVMLWMRLSSDKGFYETVDYSCCYTDAILPQFICTHIGFPFPCVQLEISFRSTRNFLVFN